MAPRCSFWCNTPIAQLRDRGTRPRSSRWWRTAWNPGGGTPGSMPFTATPLLWEPPPLRGEKCGSWASCKCAAWGGPQGCWCRLQSSIPELLGLHAGSSCSWLGPQGHLPQQQNECPLARGHLEPCCCMYSHPASGLALLLQDGTVFCAPRNTAAGTPGAWPDPVLSEEHMGLAGSCSYNKELES